MSTNKDCRNAKTAEEYLLQCLFKAEDDRDKAIAYCDEVRAKEDEHKAYIKQIKSRKNLFSNQEFMEYFILFVASLMLLISVLFIIFLLRSAIIDKTLMLLQVTK